MRASTSQARDSPDLTALFGFARIRVRTFPSPDTMYSRLAEVTKRPTIIEVARLAGVSKATVARVVNGKHNLVRDETRRRVLKAIDQIGYEPNAIASSLRNNRTLMVMVCIPDITNPFWTVVARGVQDNTESRGYTAVTVNSDWNAERAFGFLRLATRNRFDGLIINPVGMTNRDLVKLGIPVVIVGNGDLFPDFDSVGSDTEQGTNAALQFLYDCGHRRIALINGISTRDHPQVRHNTYRSFLARHNLPLDNNLVQSCDFSDRGGYAAMCKLLTLPEPPTAVFAGNDILAIGALRATTTMGKRVPEDVAIIGMDDIYAAALTSPALTTVSKPKYEIGVIAAQYLLERISNIAPPTVRHIKLPCHLIERHSTARR